jgi:hypothetical protein
LDLKSSRLAREINIDSSLIYKWLRNERVPSNESPYIELILKCIEKRLNNSSQRKAVLDVLSYYEIELAETADICILDSLRMILQDSQGYSVRLHNKMKIRRKFFSSGISTVAECFENADTRSGKSENYNYSAYDLHNTAADTENLLYGRDYVQIIKGTLKILYSAVNLLKQLPKTPCPNSGTILMTFNSDIRSPLETKAISGVCVQTLYDLLSGGWNIIFKLRLDNNMNRTIKIIEYIQVLLAAGDLAIYYDRQHADFSSNIELCILPQTGALFSFSTCSDNQIDSAFLFRSKKSIEMLTKRFYCDLNSAKPLLRSYPPQQSPEFQYALTEAEVIPGDKYVFKGGLSTVTFPLCLYEKYLGLSGKPSHEISYRIFLHKKRIDSFEKQVKHYKFKDICFIESINRLIDKKEYSPDENYILNDNVPNNEDIILHLENLIDLLKKHDNYNIAFVSQTQFVHMGGINWMVKGKDSVLAEAFRIGLPGGDPSDPDGDSSLSEMNFVITESGVVNAFHDYFLILWDNIPDEFKDKKKSIAWLRSLIKKMRQPG